MIESISTLRCSVCGMRESCRRQAENSPWLRQQIDSFRKCCRNTRAMLVVYVALIAALALLSMGLGSLFR
jgi:hypothetical protein